MGREHVHIAHLAGFLPYAAEIPQERAFIVLCRELSGLYRGFNSTAACPEIVDILRIQKPRPLFENLAKFLDTFFEALFVQCHKYDLDSA